MWPPVDLTIGGHNPGRLTKEVISLLARERRKLILPFLAPFLILHTFLFAYPAIQALPLSLMDFSGIGENIAVHRPGKL